MSKFIDKLKRQAGSRAQPIGFRPAESVRTPPLLLGLHLSQPEAGAAAAKANPDALLIDIEKPRPTDLSKIIKAAGDVPVGCALSGAPTAEEWQRLQGSGCDFFVFEPTNMTPRLLASTQAGKVLRVDPSLPIGLLRAIDQLEVDAVLVNPPVEGSISLHDLLAYHHVASLVAKPLLTYVSSAVEASELEALRDARIGGVFVSDASKDELELIRRNIDALPPSRRRARGLEAILPSLPGTPKEVEVEEEGEETEED